MAPSAGWKPPGLGVALAALLGSLLRGRAIGDAFAPAAAPPRASLPPQLVWRYIDAVNALRAEGFTCPGGLHFPPNPVLLKFDCSLWRAGDLRLQELQGSNASGRLDLLVDEQGLAESSSAEPGAVQEVLGSFKRSSLRCREMMDPRARLVGVAYGASGSRRQDRRYWIQHFSAEEAFRDASCLRATALSSAQSAPIVVPTPSPLSPAVERLRPAEERRLKASGAASGGGSSGGITGSISTTTAVPYPGPGQQFGMVLLIVSVSIFFTGTFGSIIIGNCVLKARAHREVSAMTMPNP